MSSHTWEEEYTVYRCRVCGERHDVSAKARDLQRVVLRFLPDEPCPQEMSTRRFAQDPATERRGVTVGPTWQCLPLLAGSMATALPESGSGDGAGVLTIMSLEGTREGGRLIECRFAQARADAHYSVILAHAPRAPEEMLAPGQYPCFYAIVDRLGFWGFTIAAAGTLDARRVYRVSYRIIA